MPMQLGPDDTRLFNDQIFTLGSLRFLRGSFVANYLSSTKEHGHLPFITVFEQKTIIKKTYQEFHKDVLCAASHIRSHLKDEKTVVLIGGNSYLFSVYIVATLLLGKTLCPLNPAEGWTRLTKKILQLNENTLVFHAPSNTPPEGLKALRMTLEQKVPSFDISSLNLELREDSSPLILIFTSGTTGYSKVVMQTEKNILSNVDALIEHHELFKKKTILTPLPLFHVNALEFSFFCTLFSGGQLILLENAEPFLLKEALLHQKVHILSILPPIIKILHFMKNQFQEPLRQVDYVVSAAAPLSVELAKAFFADFSVRIIQGYGLSEAVNFSAVMPIQVSDVDYEEMMFHHGFPSIGKSLRGNHIDILKEDGSLAGAQIPGEICIRGHNVMNSYKDIAPEVLFKDGYLHTGDLGFYLEKEGERFFFISGRLKDVIKRFGESVSLREVDDLVNTFAFPDFDAIAVPFENDYAGEEIGLVVKGNPQLQTQPETFREHLQQMPVFLRPKIIIFTDESIRTPSGKPCRWQFNHLFKSFKAKAIGVSPSFHI